MENAYELMKTYNKATEMRKKCWDARCSSMDKDEMKELLSECSGLLLRYTNMIEDVMKTMGGGKNEKS